MKNIDNFEQFFEAKKLHNSEIPESVFIYLFKQRLLRNNNVDVVSIKNKKELRKIIKDENEIEIIALKDENNFIFFHNRYSWKKFELIGKINGDKISAEYSLTSTLSKIEKDYKIFKVIDNKFKPKKYYEYRPPDNEYNLIDADDKTFEFLLKYLKELRKNADEKLINSLSDYQKSEMKDKYNHRIPEETEEIIDAIYNINTMIYDFKKRDKNSFMNFLKLFDEYRFRKNEEEDIENNKTTVKQLIFSKVARIVNQWDVDDFVSMRSSRKLLSRAEKKQDKINKFKI